VTDEDGIVVAEVIEQGDEITRQVLEVVVGHLARTG